MILIKKITMIILVFLIYTGYTNCQTEDSTAKPVNADEVPEWLMEKIKILSLDEKRYGMSSIFRYDSDSTVIYWINNPLSSCIYCELYHADGSRLNEGETKEFIDQKGEPILIWQNHPAVPFDSLKKNIEKPPNNE